MNVDFDFQELENSGIAKLSLQRTGAEVASVRSVEDNMFGDYYVKLQL